MPFRGKILRSRAVLGQNGISNVQATLKRRTETAHNQLEASQQTSCVAYLYLFALAIGKCH